MERINVYDPIKILVVLGAIEDEEFVKYFLASVKAGIQSWGRKLNALSLIDDCLLLFNDLQRQEIDNDGLAPCLKLSYSYQNVDVVVLVSPTCYSVNYEIGELITSRSCEKLVVYGGHSFDNKPNWYFQDGVFSAEDLKYVLNDYKILSAMKATGINSTVTIACCKASKWQLDEENEIKIKFLDPFDDSNVDADGERQPSLSLKGMNSFLNGLENALSGQVDNIFEQLGPPVTTGYLKVRNPCIYIFPSGNGDSAFFSINGFNILINGGALSRPWFWRLVRHHDRIDCVIATHLGNDCLTGINNFYLRKVQERKLKLPMDNTSDEYKNLAQCLQSPDIGCLFMNAPTKFASLSLRKRNECIDAGDDVAHEHEVTQLLGIRKVDAAIHTLRLAEKLGIDVQSLTRKKQPEPIVLFSKYGIGRLELHVISPAEESKELSHIREKWGFDANSTNLSAKSKVKLPDGGEGTSLVSDLASICCLLVWRPARKTEKILRVLFPGNTSQQKIFDGLDKMNGMDFLSVPDPTQAVLESNKASSSSKASNVASSKVKTVPTSKPQGNKRSTTTSKSAGDATAPKTAAPKAPSKPAFKAPSSTTSSSLSRPSSSTLRGKTVPLLGKMDVSSIKSTSEVSRKRPTSAAKKTTASKVETSSLKNKKDLDKSKSKKTHDSNGKIADSATNSATSKLAARAKSAPAERVTSTTRAGTKPTTSKPKTPAKKPTVGQAKQSKQSLPKSKVGSTKQTSKKESISSSSGEVDVPPSPKTMSSYIPVTDEDTDTTTHDKEGNLPKRLTPEGQFEIGEFNEEKAADSTNIQEDLEVLTANILPEKTNEITAFTEEDISKAVEEVTNIDWNKNKRKVIGTVSAQVESSTSTIGDHKVDNLDSESEKQFLTQEFSGPESGEAGAYKAWVAVKEGEQEPTHPSPLTGSEGPDKCPSKDENSNIPPLGAFQSLAEIARMDLDRPANAEQLQSLMMMNNPDSEHQPSENSAEDYRLKLESFDKHVECESESTDQNEDDDKMEESVSTSIPSSLGSSSLITGTLDIQDNKDCHETFMELLNEACRNAKLKSESAENQSSDDKEDLREAPLHPGNGLGYIHLDHDTPPDKESLPPMDLPCSQSTTSTMSKRALLESPCSTEFDSCNDPSMAGSMSTSMNAGFTDLDLEQHKVVGSPMPDKSESKQLGCTYDNNGNKSDQVLELNPQKSIEEIKESPIPNASSDENAEKSSPAESSPDLASQPESCNAASVYLTEEALIICAAEQPNAENDQPNVGDWPEAAPQCDDKSVEICNGDAENKPESELKSCPLGDVTAGDFDLCRGFENDSQKQVYAHFIGFVDENDPEKLEKEAMIESMAAEKHVDEDSSETDIDENIKLVDFQSENIDFDRGLMYDSVPIDELSTLSTEGSQDFSVEAHQIDLSKPDISDSPKDTSTHDEEHTFSSDKDDIDNTLESLHAVQENDPREYHYQLSNEGRAAMLHVTNEMYSHYVDDNQDSPPEAENLKQINYCSVIEESVLADADDEKHDDSFYGVELKSGGACETQSDCDSVPTLHAEANRDMQDEDTRSLENLHGDNEHGNIVSFNNEYEHIVPLLPGAVYNFSPNNPFASDFAPQQQTDRQNEEDFFPDRSKDPEMALDRPLSSKSGTKRTNSGSAASKKSNQSAYYFDLTYVPHHANKNHCNEEFFKRIRSKYYVVSGFDTSEDEPCEATLSCLLEGKKTWSSKAGLKQDDSNVVVIPTHNSTALHDWYQRQHKELDAENIHLVASGSKVIMHDETMEACKIEF